jgi:putative ABC transport system permease protein
MRRVALRGIRSHLGRFCLSILAVLLGVAFVAGTFSLREMMSDTFDRIVEAGTDADTYVQGAVRAEGDDPMSGEHARFPLETADTIAAVDGVAGVVPDVSGPIVLVGADGTAVLSSGPPSFGLGLHPDERALTVADGREPAGPGEIALESSALERSGLAIGDTTTVLVAGELREVEVVGELAIDTPMAGAIMVGLDWDTAVATYAPDGATSTVAVYAADGVGQTELADAVRAALEDVPAAAAAGVRVLTGDQARAEAAEQWTSALGFVSTFLLVFAGIALFVGTFIIANTFSMVVRQRQREYAMLRAVGASPSQVFGSVLAQAGLVGVVGSLLGVGAGLGLVEVVRGVLAGMDMELVGEIPLDGSTVAISVLVGTVVSLVAAVVPARRAALTAPVEAMRDEVAATERPARLRTAIGAVLLAGGLAAVVAATTGVVEENQGALLGVGAAATLVAMLALAPAIVPPVLGGLAAPLVAGVRPLGALARGNVTRHPRRTASTAGALMIGMALVGAASVLAASTQASVRDVVDNQARTDLILQSATWDVPAALVDEIDEVEGVGRVDVLRISRGVTVEDEEIPLIGVPAGFFPGVLEVPVAEGDPTDLGPGRAVAQLVDAEERGWSVGDTLTVAGATGEREVTLAGIIDSGILGLPLVVEESDFAAVADPGSSVVDSVFVKAAPGTAVADLRADLAEVAEPYVIVSVMDAEEYGDAVAAQVNQMLVILYALLGLSVVIAVLGIVNTLAMSIAERTREIGLLRAVGLGRLQLASVVTIESVLTALFGTVLGVGVGAGLAAAMTRVFADEGLNRLAIPWDGLGILLGLAVVVGVVAALWPAARAARMDVLEAIAFE